jgi:Uma2 family endonuclease
MTTNLNLPPIEDIDVEDLPTLPQGYGYELHEGNLVIMTPSTFWHKEIASRLCDMLRAAGLRAYQDPGVLGHRPRDNRLPDVGVVKELPAGKSKRSYSNLPGSAFLLVIEVVSSSSHFADYIEKMAWYAELNIPAYWIADLAPDGSDDDALVKVHRLAQADGKAVYVWERHLLLSELEAEYRAQ